MASVDPAQALPIDIAYNKLADWLVDRRKVPQDFRKRLGGLRARVAVALSKLERSLDPGFLDLTPDCTGYFEAKHVRDVLSALPESRNLFGGLAGAAGEWDAIVSAYEKDLIFLGEAAQIMLQSTNYDIPYQKKQIAKLQQQLTDLDRKESELKRSVVQSATKYREACQELGIPGVNVRAELVGLGATLPKIFAEIVEGLSCDAIGSALEYYQAFCAYTHAIKEDDHVLPTLTELRAHPPDVHDALNATLPISESQAHHQSDVQNTNQIDVRTREIDWSVDTADVDLSVPTDISALKEPDGQDPEKNASDERVQSEIMVHGIGKVELKSGITWNVEIPTEIDWDIGALQESDVQEPDHMARVDKDQSEAMVNNGGEDVKSKSDINWDVEIPTAIDWDIDVEEDGATPDVMDAGDISTEVSGSEIVGGEAVSTSWFAKSDNRNRLLDDLLELKIFLKHRVLETQSEASGILSLLQVVLPSSIAQHGSESLRSMESSTAKVVNLVSNRRTRDLILLATSFGYLNRVEGSLIQKKQSELKLQSSIVDLNRKRTEYRMAQGLLWPKQAALIARTQSIKQHVEKILSTQYNGRKVNIIGEINTLLGRV